MSNTKLYDKRTMAFIEATRYMNNAEDALKKSAIDGALYSDSKYVCTACGVAYKGVLIALDAFFEMRGIPRPPKAKRASIDYYKRNLAQLDLKMLGHLNAVYSILHIAGYYESMTNVKSVRGGFDSAYELIAKIKPAEELPQEAFSKPSPLSQVRHFMMTIFA